jgi:non-homologous end joining protein Ku
MVAHTMFFAGEIRKDQEYRAKVREIQPRELDLAKRLIETMAVPFEPAKFRNTWPTNQPPRPESPKSSISSTPSRRASTR